MIEVAYDHLESIEKKLIDEAIRIRARAYAPYSNYYVGAALVDSAGEIHTGCNVESADYTLSTHAEMVAVNSMVKSGCLQIRGMAVAVESKLGYGFPCGLCRQKIREFAAGIDFPVFGINLDADNNILNIYRSTLGELLPWSFDVTVLNSGS